VPNTIALLFATTLLLLCGFALLSFSHSGEILKTGEGTVYQCAQLSGANTTSLFHATIEDKSGAFIIASLKDCKPGAKVTVLIKRGALYFNTVYAAENNL